MSVNNKKTQSSIDPVERKIIDMRNAREKEREEKRKKQYEQELRASEIRIFHEIAETARSKKANASSDAASSPKFNVWNDPAQNPETNVADSSTPNVATNATGTQAPIQTDSSSLQNLFPGKIDAENPMKRFNRNVDIQVASTVEHPEIPDYTDEKNAEIKTAKKPLEKADQKAWTANLLDSLTMLISPQDSAIAARKKGKDIPDTKLGQAEAEVKKAESEIAAINEKYAAKKSDFYESLRSLPDFETKSQYQSTKDPDVETKYNATTDTYTHGYDDLQYEYINSVFDKERKTEISDILRSLYGENATPGAGVNGQIFNGNIDELTADEQSMYNYLYSVYGKKSANDYLGTLESELNARRAQTDAKKAEEFAEEHPWLATALGVGEKTIQGPIALIGITQDKLIGKELDPNAWYNAPMLNSNTLLETVSSNIEEAVPGAGGKILSGAYDFGVGLGSTALSVALGGAAGKPVAAFVQASNSFAPTVINAKARGASDGQALALGTASAAIGYISEKINLDTFFDSDQLTESAARYIVKNALSEGVGEVSEDLVNLAADALVMGQENNRWAYAKKTYKTELQEKRLKKYLEQGYAESEAQAKVQADDEELDKEAGSLAWQDIVLELGGDFATGAGVGGALASINVLSKKIDNAITTEKERRATVINAQNDALTDAILSSETDLDGGVDKLINAVGNAEREIASSAGRKANNSVDAAITFVQTELNDIDRQIERSGDSTALHEKRFALSKIMQKLQERKNGSSTAESSTDTQNPVMGAIDSPASQSSATETNDADVPSANAPSAPVADVAAKLKDVDDAKRALALTETNVQTGEGDGLSVGNAANIVLATTAETDAGADDKINQTIDALRKTVQLANDPDSEIQLSEDARTRLRQAEDALRNKRNEIKAEIERRSAETPATEIGATKASPAEISDVEASSAENVVANPAVEETLSDTQNPQTNGEEIALAAETAMESDATTRPVETAIETQSATEVSASEVSATDTQGANVSDVTVQSETDPSLFDLSLADLTAFDVNNDAHLARLVDLVSTEAGTSAENEINQAIDYLRNQYAVVQRRINSDRVKKAQNRVEIQEKGAKTLQNVKSLDEALRNRRSEIEAIRNARSAATAVQASSVSQQSNDVEKNAENLLQNQQIGDIINAESETAPTAAGATVVTEASSPTTETATVGDSSESSPSRDYTLNYRQTKHTKTGETLHVFSIDGSLKNEDFAKLKAKMKELGGYYSSYVKGFIVPADRVSDVSGFANVRGATPGASSETNVGGEAVAGESGIPNGAKTEGQGNPQANETSVADEKAESTSESTSSVIDKKAPETAADRQQAMASGVIPDATVQTSVDTSVDGASMPTETVGTDSLVNTFYSEIADRIVTEYLESGKKLTVYDLAKIAESIYHGTMAEGAFSSKDMTDALELAVNRYILKQIIEHPETFNVNDAESAARAVQWLEALLERLPTQTKRTEEQISLQQFSTPPTIAFLANWVANVDGSDYMLEPSAGIGGMAIFAKAFGATTAVNEISERRLGALRALGFDHVYSENAEQLDNILPDHVKPTVVVMNPPFSSSGGRVKNSSAISKIHVEQALNRLEDGGRLVVILGQGASDDAPTFSGWWNDLRKKYNIRANIGIDGSNYRKYGTTFNVRLIVIDKTGTQTGKTITGDYKSLSEIPGILEGIRNDRTHIGTAERNAAVSGGGEVDRSRISGDVSSDVGVGVSGVSGGKPDGQRSSSDAVLDVHNGESAVNVGLDGVEQNSGGSVQASDGVPSDGSIRGGREVEGRGVSGNSDDGRPGISMDVGESVRGDTGNSETVVQSGTGVSGTSVNRDANPETAQTVNAKVGTKANVSDDSVYSTYVPPELTVTGAQPHPENLVESSAMASVSAPEITYTPNIDQSIIDAGKLSDVQLENVSRAGQAHQEILPSGVRKGYFIGDGTGVGKGRQAAGILLDNRNQGRKKAVWVSVQGSLIFDARRDWVDLGQDANDIFDLDAIRKGRGKDKNKTIPEDGILFVPYSTLASTPRKKGQKSNLDVIMEWLGDDFDGAIIFDEAHTMNNLIPVKGKRGDKKISAAAVKGNALQEAFPNARVVYMSATGATEVQDLCFASRLGLWGEGTAFPTARDFVNQIAASGITGMELVASSLKANGLYQARSISYEGVKYSSLLHNLTEDQIEMYNTFCDAWQIVFQNVQEALKATGADPKAAYSQFYSLQQNFFNQILTAMAMPSLIEDAKRRVAAGEAPVIQLVNTNESQQNAEIEAAQAEGRSLDELDITPKGILIRYLESSFPVLQNETYLDENGAKRTRQVKDSAGNPVQNRQAVAARDALIAKVNEISFPTSPIDMIIEAFGAENVAEVTGRRQRVVTKDGEATLEPMSQPDFRLAEVKAFQDGKKQVLVFSGAGSTGISFHADRRAKNQKKRIHYVLQPGFNSKETVQKFGRTHRTNEVTKPEYVLVTTNASAQKRFISTIARRLDQLGALTKGQRQTGSGLFGEKDNLESALSLAAMDDFFKRVGRNQVDGIDGKALFKKLGLYNKLYNEYGNFKPELVSSIEMKTFLNRLLALHVDEQNIVFGEFESIRQRMYNDALEAGTLDTGISQVKVDKITVNQSTVVYKDKKSGAETVYVRATAYNRLVIIETVEDAQAFKNGFSGLVRTKDGDVYAVYRISDMTDPSGRVRKRYVLQSPDRSKKKIVIETTLKTMTAEIPKSEWQTAWSEQVKSLPEFNETTIHFIAGSILNVWNKLPSDGNVKAVRITTDDGTSLLGRVIPSNQIDGVLRSLGLSGVKTKDKLTGVQAYDAVLKSGTTLSFSLTYGARNGVKRARVSGEKRLELTGYNLFVLKNRYPDVIVETIDGKKRYFIPTGEKGVAILNEIAKTYGLTRGKENGDSDLYSTVPGKWTRSGKDGETRKIKSAADLHEEAKRIFGISINTGKVGKKRARGIFKTHSGTIRTRVYGDIPTIAHEIGHYFDKRYELSTSLETQSLIDHYRSQLESANYNESVFPNEAVACYFADLMRNREDTEADFPEFSQFLAETLSAEDLSKLNEYATETNEYFAADLMERRNASVRYRHEGESKFQLAAFLENPLAYTGQLAKSFWTRFTDAFVDDLAPLKPFGEAYDLAFKERTTNAIASGRLNIAFTDNDGNVIGESLADTLAGNGIDQTNAREFDAYLIARIALDRIEAAGNGLNIETLVYADAELQDKQNIIDAIQTYEREHPNFADAANGIYEYRSNLLAIAVDAGIISQDLADFSTENFPHYVPLFRDAEDINVMNSGRPSDKAKTPDAPIGRFKGSGREIYSPIENLALQTVKFTKSILQNKVRQAFTSYIDANEEMGWAAEQVPASKVLDTVSTGEIAKKLKSFDSETLAGMTVDEKTQLMEDVMEHIGESVGMYKLAANQGANVISVLRDGKPVYYEIHDQRLMEALLASTPQQANAIMSVLSTATNLFKALTTAYNPAYTVKNVVRDASTGYIHSDTENNPVRYLKDLVSAFIEIFQNSEGYREFLANGGSYATAITQDRRSFEKTWKALVKFSGSESNLRKMLRAISRVLSTGMEAGESSSRYAEYKRNRAQGKSKTESIRASQEVTVNFSRRGKLGKTINQAVPYFNSGIQGAAKNLSLFAHPEKNKAKIIKMLGLNLVMSALVMGVLELSKALGDEEAEESYVNLPAYKKRDSWCFYRGAGKFLLVPKPTGLAEFGNLFEMAVEMAALDNPESFSGFLGHLADAYLPSTDLIIIGTAFDLAKNESYSGAPIVSESMSNLPEELQYNENTSGLAILIGSTLGISPQQVDYVIKNNGGFIYDFINTFTRNDGSSLGERLKEGITDDLFGLDAFTADSVYSNGFVDAFYEQKEAYDKEAAGYKSGKGNYDAYSVFGAYKYAKVADAYQKANRLIKEEENDVAQRAAKATLNATIASVHRTSETDTDKAVFELSQKTGSAVSDIAPYVVVPDTLTETVNGEKTEYALTALEIIEYFQESQLLFEAVYPEILDGEGTDEQKSAALKEAKKVISSYLRRRWLKVLKEKEDE